MFEDEKKYRVYYTEKGNEIAWYTPSYTDVNEARGHRDGLLSLPDITNAVVVEETITKKVVQ